jgi:exosortase D (VPLPA-CTERM-specific)
MEITKENAIRSVWKLPISAWVGFIGLGALLAFIFYAGIKFLLQQWQAPEYGYAYLIPVITLFLIWQKNDKLQDIPFIGSWMGFIVVAFGVFVFFLGELSALNIFIQYALLIVIAGLALSFTGSRGFRTILVPILLLIFMVPLPGFIYEGLSNNLQLLSSRIGVWIIRLFDISVYLEGNVIDLGGYKLQVVEACSGLRYLFPLMTLGFIAAYFFKGAFWKRGVIFLSAIPITVLMNSFRVGMIGVLVEHWGRAMAEGFLHDFEGWVIFMACTAILVIEMWILAKIGGKRQPLREVFGLDLPAPPPKDAAVNYRRIPRPFLAAALLLIFTGAVSAALPQRAETVLHRKEFAEFPMNLGEWQGKQEKLERMYIDSLNFDDYIMADYMDRQQHLVNFYVGYYATQRADKVPHSPRACIPGGGWIITSLTQRHIEGVTIGGKTLEVNRLVISKEGTRQLVYYWFQQRSRVLTSEYLVKWYLFWDAMRLNRTDGALVRFVTTLEPGQDLEVADRRLSEFAKVITPQLGAYIPE